MKFEAIHQWFSRTAETFSAETAIDSANKRVTYGELETNSNRLANFLLSSGIVKGSPVMILAQHSVTVMTAILGILKAGCVFVPLDPHIPKKRLEAITQIISPDWFVIEPDFMETLISITRGRQTTARVICLDEQPVPSDAPNIRVENYAQFTETHKPANRSLPDDMCYVYFTSGSTGAPKGIVGRLKGIDHFVRWEINTFGFDRHTRVAQFTAISFDAFLRDMFVALCTGGTVCVPPGRDSILDTRKLIDWIDDQKITLIHCVPSLFRAVLNEDLRADQFRSLKHILLAGEPLLPGDIKRWINVYGERVQLVNLYGPTETTMTKFFYVVQRSDGERRSIPIGKPMEGARALVLDEKGVVCPPGRVGEIYIRTPFRSLGYYQQPELTGEVFIRNPFSQDSSDIIYKTGDLGRLLEDGNFEFLGRKDQQVKIRGVRIELGEIEGLLREHTSVKDTAVVDREDASGHKYLCAYVVFNKDDQTDALRDFLSASLPDYMLPAAFVTLDKLPRTITGKVDRRALSTTAQSVINRQTYVAPRTPVEVTLAGIWTRLLGIDKVGINDNFFQIGGHSLLATQLISRVSESFNVGLPLRSLFDSPTLAGLALTITQAQVEQEDDEDMAQLLEEIKNLSDAAIDLPPYESLRATELEEV
jgi:amino acid adenylation domain-containing protein